MSETLPPVIPKCCFVCQQKAKKLFKVPKDEERLKKWMELLGRTDLLARGYKFLQRNAKICSAHFSDWCFTNSNKERLITFALPETSVSPCTSDIIVAPSATQSWDKEEYLKIVIPGDKNKDAPIKLLLSDVGSAIHKDHVVKFNVPKSDLSLPEILSRVSSVQRRIPVTLPDTKPTSNKGFNKRSKILLDSNSKLKQESDSDNESISNHALDFDTGFLTDSEEVHVKEEYFTPPPSPPSGTSISREEQIIRSQRSTISRLKRQIERLKANKYTFIDKLKHKMDPEHYEFIRSQIKQASRKKQSDKARRWSNEEKAFALKVYSLSPSVYSLLKTKLLLPTRHTLERIPYSERLAVHNSTSSYFAEEFMSLENNI